MVQILSIDLETRSPVDLKRSGPYRYFEHPLTEILCLAWAINDGPVHGWTPGQLCPPPVADLIATGGEISGWNVNFERQGWRSILSPEHGWPEPRLEQFRDTAAQAAAQTLPRKLEQAAAVLRIPEQKDEAGRKLMLMMAKPRKDGSWYEGDRKRLLEYCKDDVRAERAIRKRLQPLSEAEMTLWRFDQIINDRGITVDLDLVRDMRAIVVQHAAFLDQQMNLITGGIVEKCTQTERLKKWLGDRNDQRVESLAKGAIQTLLRSEWLCDDDIAAIELWQEAAKASVRKLQAADLCANGDRRARGLLRFHGANTGRWAGQLLQPQNFTRGTGLVKDPDFAIEMIKLRSAAVLEWCWDHPLTVVSDCLRGIMTAGPGMDLMAGDYKNIEARITAWLSGNLPKLEAFKRQDDGTGPEIYKLTAASIYHCPVAAIGDHDPRRQTGKTAELALGFGGGVDALHKMAINYRVDMAEALPALFDAASPEERVKVNDAYDLMIRTGNDKGLDEEAWKACKYTVRAWRRANPATVAMWDDFHSSAWHAVHEPGAFTAGRIRFERNNGFLWMTLPSGRSLAYPAPAVENRVVPWSDKTLPLVDQEHKDMLTVLSFLPSGAKDRYAFYPGLTFQHAVQAIARDILAHGMANVESDGYPVIMSIHDEVICEVPKGTRNIGDFLVKLCILPDWAAGLPLLANGWRGFRYRKV